MRDGRTKRDVAHFELRQRLTDGLAMAGLNKTLLARKAQLSRTTVQLAFQADAPVPSAETVAALARALNVPEQELLALRRTAIEDAGPTSSGLGKPISEWDPHQLEVHPAGPVGRTYPSQLEPALPRYVQRDHDLVMAEAVRDIQRGNSRMLVLVGSSSTGKTRACWEAVQPLADQGWRLWHPFDPTRAEAALADLAHVEPFTVVWLNEAQHYLGAPEVGERIAAALHRLLTERDYQPVLILGSLWPQYANVFAALPSNGAVDPHSRVRELLADRTIAVPETFSQRALRTAAAYARDGDRLLADALSRASGNGRVTQDLAGAPELLRRFEHSSPAARAVLEAAMDARRLGVGLDLPESFLSEAAIDYLSENDYGELGEDWVAATLAELEPPVHGRQAPLRRVAMRPKRRPPSSLSAPAQPSEGTSFRLADYLEQHGRATRGLICPPASFWDAAYKHLTRHEDLRALAASAESRGRLQWGYDLTYRSGELGDAGAFIELARRHVWAEDIDAAEELYQRAADAGNTEALSTLAQHRARAGDHDVALALAQQAANAGDTSAFHTLARLRIGAQDHARAEALYRRATDAGDLRALVALAWIREEHGDHDEAEAFAQQAADAGDTSACFGIALIRRRRGDLKGAEIVYQKAAETGDVTALIALVRVREEAGDADAAGALAEYAAEIGDAKALIALADDRAEAGDHEAAEALYSEAADAGSVPALFKLMQICEKAGDYEDAQAFAQRAVDTGDSSALFDLMRICEEAENYEEADALAQQAADAGDTSALFDLALSREEAGDYERATYLFEKAADAGDTNAVAHLVHIREEAEDHVGAEALAQAAADAGDTSVLVVLARLREEAGDRGRAEYLAQQAADAGDISGLLYLALHREDAGDYAGATNLAQQASDAGDPQVLLSLARMHAYAWGRRYRAEDLYHRAVEAGAVTALAHLSLLREEAGDHDEAERLARQATDAGDTSALFDLAQRREANGDPDGAEFLAQQAAAGGDTRALLALAGKRRAVGSSAEADNLERQVIDAGDLHLTELRKRLPFGLDPDGEPSLPWMSPTPLAWPYAP